jgi:hypothetical protein
VNGLLASTMQENSVASCLSWAVLAVQG